MILQTRCAGCDRAGAVLCRTCRLALAGPPPRVTAHGVIAAVPFVGRARDVVLAMKYRNRRAVAPHLGGLLVNRLLRAGVRPAVDVDVVTWAPTGRRRRHARGFDQAEAVARVVARQLGLPVRRLLDRDDDEPQTGRTRRQRLHGPLMRARPDVAGRRILVIDDVVTTGATLHAADAALRAAGARSVQLAAVAATPAGVVPHGRVLVGPWGGHDIADARRTA